MGFEDLSAKRNSPVINNGKSLTGATPELKPAQDLDTDWEKLRKEFLALSREERLVRVWQVAEKIEEPKLNLEKLQLNFSLPVDKKSS